MAEINKYEEDCEPCFWGIVINAAKNICEQVNGRNFCDTEYENFVLGKINVDEYLDKIASKVQNDDQALFTINELKHLVKEKS